VVTPPLTDIFKRNLTNLLRRRDADRRGVQIK
jgi:hypothetical protein